MTNTRKALTTGVFYMALSQYSGVLISITVGAILARLLSPDEFGIVALVTVFVSLFNLLSDFGLGAAVVQNQNLDKEDLESIFSFSILLGVILSGLFYLSAPFIASFYNEPKLDLIAKYLSLSIFFNSLIIIPKALFQKSLLFKKLGIISIAIQLFCGILAIILAYEGFSFYTLVIQSILLSGLHLIILYAIKPVGFIWRINFKSIRKILRFSTFQFFFNFINYFSRNLDNILIGKYMGVTSLGFYEKSYRLMMMPVQNLTHVVTPVLMPVLSQYENNKKIVFTTYLKVVKILAIIGFPLSVFLFFSAEEIIIIMFGNQWIESIPVFKILSLTVGIQMVLSSSGSIFQAVNRTDLLFYTGAVSALFMVIGISYGIFITQKIETVAYGLVIAFSINFMLCFYILVKFALYDSFKTFLKILLFPILVSVLLSFFLEMFEYYKPDSVFLSVLCKGIISVISLFLLCNTNQEYRTIIKNRLGK